jgi:hypothetical protein
MQVHGGDVVELDRPYLTHLERRRPRTGGDEVLDLEHRHVRAVAATVQEPARGRALLHRGDDLDERVSQRHHRVAQAEVGDARIRVRLAERQRRAQLAHRRVEVARRQHRLSQTRHPATLPRTGLGSHPQGNEPTSDRPQGGENR